MNRLRANLIVGQRYGSLILVMVGLCLQAEALAGTWTAQNSGTAADLFSVHFPLGVFHNVGGDEGWATGANTILHTIDSGTTWTVPAALNTVAA